MIRCAIYDRVSTELQASFGLSLSTQKDALTEYAREHGYEIVGYYEDEGITARKKLQNRRDFLRLLNDVKQDKIDLILVTKLDRWFRNVRDYHNTQAVLEEHHCNWKTIFEDYDTSTADGQLKINIMLAVAQNECDRTSERIRAVFDYKRKNGEHLTGKPPFGYRIFEKKLVKDEATAQIVADIFTCYLSCFSKRKTACRIQEKYQESAPSSSQISRILTKEIYAGIHGESRNYCPAYISEQDYRRICEIKDAKTYPACKEPYLFSQLIKCPFCGANFTGFVKKQTKKDGKISRYKRYRCSRKNENSHAGACISETVVENYLLEALRRSLPEIICHIHSLPLHQPQKSEEERLLEELERLNLLFQKGRISQDYYEREYERLSIIISKKGIHKPAWRRETAVPLVPRDFDAGWEALYHRLDPEHKKLFWKGILKEIQIDRNTHKLCGFTFRD